MVPFALNKCGPTEMKMMRAMDTPDSQVARAAGSLESSRKTSDPKGTGVQTVRLALYKSLSLQKKA